MYLYLVSYWGISSDHAFCPPRSTLKPRVISVAAAECCSSQLARTLLTLSPKPQPRVIHKPYHKMRKQFQPVRSQIMSARCLSRTFGHFWSPNSNTPPNIDACKHHNMASLEVSRVSCGASFLQGGSRIAVIAVASKATKGFLSSSCT